MTKMQKYRFIMFAYFPEDMHSEDILDQAEQRFGKSQGNEIIDIKYCRVIERR